MLFRKKFKFSVVMPVYNTEKYLDEAICSIINQSIDFKKNIQLIIVNDGSTDSSPQICKAYRDKYPKNIIYIDQTNQGVSAARNTGLGYVKGAYVNFFDSDDIWNTDAFQLAWDFFQKNSDDIDVIGCIQTFFEGKTGLHNLSNKFKAGDRVIDIWETPHYIQLNVCAAFIKSETAKKHRFDTSLRIGEDAKYITEIILEKEKYGVLKSAVYNIRKRTAATSITQNPGKSKYTATVERYYKYLPELSIKKYGTVIPYVQHVVLNALKSKLLSNNALPLNDVEKEQYYKDIISLIQMMDDEVLLKTNMILMPAKVYMLKLKHGHLPETAFSVNGYKLYFNSKYLGNLSVNKLVIHNIQELKNSYIVTGALRIPFDGTFEVAVKDNNQTFTAVLEDNISYNRVAFNGDVIIPGRTFTVELPNNKKITDYQFEISYNGFTVPQKIKF